MQKELDSKLLRYSSAVGITFAVIWLGFWSYCYQIAPRVPDEFNNRLYPVNFHGTAIYLNEFEYYTLYAIPLTALLVGVVSAVFLRFKKRN